MSVTQLREAAFLGGHISEEKVGQLSPLVLAYVGDTVYDLFIRTHIVAHHDLSVRRLNEHAVAHVRAGAQCATVREMYDMLTEKEQEIFRRGRNAKSAHTPKHAEISEYRDATGFEALLGYLYLSGNETRLSALLLAAARVQEEEETCPKPR